MRLVCRGQQGQAEEVSYGFLSYGLADIWTTYFQKGRAGPSSSSSSSLGGVAGARKSKGRCYGMKWYKMMEHNGDVVN